MVNSIYNNIASFAVKRENLPRPRIDILFSAAVKHPLVMVIAGTGYGKTQAVKSFLNVTKARVVWIHLSMLDNLPTRFWENLLRSVSVYSRDLADKLKYLGFPDSLIKLNQFLLLITKEIDAGDQVLFIFDDFHVLHESSIIDFIENITSVNLEIIRFILISRANLNYSFSTMFSNDLVQITREDLYFTLRETANYFDIQGVEISQQNIENIYSYTQGWPLAIQLIGLSIKRHGFIADNPPTNTASFMFQLIDEEFFSLYSLDIQIFLIKISLLDNLPAGLIEELSVSQLVTVKEVLCSNLFIQYIPPLQQYSLNNLFLEFLTKKQIQLDKATIKDTYLKAASWCEAHNLKIDALTYYDKCNYFEKVWDIILQYDSKGYPKKLAELFINLINNFPDKLVKQQPIIRVVRARCLLNNLKIQAAFEEALQVQRELAALPQKEEFRIVLREASTVLALIRLTKKTYDSQSFAKMADKYLPSGNSDYDSNSNFVEMNDTLILSNPAAGELEKMLKAFFDTMPHAANIMHSSGYGAEYLAAAEVHFYRWNLRPATKYAYKAIYKAQQQNQVDIVCSGYFLLIRIGLAYGNYTMIISILEKLRTYAAMDKIFLGISSIAEGWFFEAVGQPEKLADLVIGNTPPIHIGRNSLINVRLLMLEGNYYEMLALLEQLDELYRQKGLLVSLISVQIFRAIGLYYIGNLWQYIDALQAAYSLAHSNNIIMPFVMMGNAMRTVIANARRMNGHHIPQKWLDAIYTKAGTLAKRLSYVTNEYEKANKLSKTQTTVDLTIREKEIMKNLSRGLTRAEIANDMDISINTVKSMLENIYNKLGE